MDVDEAAARFGGVHVAAFGFSNPDHVLSPLRLLGADAFFLLENPDDRAAAFHAAGGRDGKSRRDVLKELDGSGVAWDRRTTNLWDPAAVAGTLREIQRSVKGRTLYVNISTGPNTVAVGATVASLFSNIQLYHPGGDDPASPLSRAVDALRLPAWKARPLGARELDVLEVLGRLQGSATGRHLKDELRKHYAANFVDGGGKALSASGLHNRLTSVFGTLQEAGAITLERRQRSMVVRRTEGGAKMLEVFRPRERTRQTSLAAATS